MNFFFVTFKIGFEFHTYCCQTKIIHVINCFQDFSAGLEKIRTLTKITSLLGKMYCKFDPIFKWQPVFAFMMPNFRPRVKHFTEKDPHLASNDFDTFFL